jgi:[citrate (pro-3S)-lyase] ligase
LQTQLPKYGIDVVEIPRRTFENTPISASAVRNALKNEELQTVQTLVAPTTFAYLTEKHLI